VNVKAFYSANREVLRQFVLGLASAVAIAAVRYVLETISYYQSNTTQYVVVWQILFYAFRWLDKYLAKSKSKNKITKFLKFE